MAPLPKAVNEPSERRGLRAILSADVSGYSRLMGADEEGTLARLKAVLAEVVDPMIAKHLGRIVKKMGDGHLVDFASVVDATRCAVEWQAAMAERNAGVSVDKRIDYRIGVNLGDIILEDGDIFGDGVNIAARLEGIAEPGGIWVSQAAHDQVCNLLNVRFEDMGPQVLKNIARPVRAFRVLAEEKPLNSEVLILQLGARGWWRSPEPEIAAAWRDVCEEIKNNKSRFCFISAGHGGNTFGTPGSHLYNALPGFKGETRALLCNPSSDLLAQRAFAMGMDKGSYLAKGSSSVSRLRELYQSGQAVDGRYYRRTPFKMVITNQTLILRFHPPERGVEEAQVGRFVSGGAIYQMFLSEFEEIWHLSANAPMDLRPVGVRKGRAGRRTYEYC